MAKKQLFSPVVLFGLAASFLFSGSVFAVDIGLSCPSVGSLTMQGKYIVGSNPGFKWESKSTYFKKPSDLKPPVAVVVNPIRCLRNQSPEDQSPEDQSLYVSLPSNQIFCVYGGGKKAVILQAKLFRVPDKMYMQFSNLNWQKNMGFDQYICQEGQNCPYTLTGSLPKDCQ